MSETDTSEVIAPAKNGNGTIHEEHQIVPSGIPMDLITAAQGNVDVLEKLLNLWERRVDRDREIEANRALVDLRKEIPQIERKKTLDTGKGKYKIADMEDIDEVIRPHLNEHGFGFTFRTLEETNEYVLVEGMLIHQATGWVFRSPRRELIIIGPGQNRAQAGGASQTYAIRYLKIAMLDLVLKGEDTDGRPERTQGPTSPPNPEDVERLKKAMSNQWAKAQEDGFKRLGEKWTVALCEAFATAPTSEDLNALVDLVRDNVNALDAGKQKQIGAALMKARARLSVTPEKFDFPVKDALGETDGELFSEVPGWVREFMEYWRSAQSADDHENLLHHNADALAMARKMNPALLKEVDSWQKEQPVDQRWETKETEGVEQGDRVPLVFSPVQPPMNNGKPDWNVWLGAMQQELFTMPTPEDLPAWMEAQKEVIADAEILARQMVIRFIAKQANAWNVPKPDWLLGLILPIKAACNHREWGEARMAELYWIATKDEFDVAVKDAMARMQVIKKEDAKTFERVKAAFSEKLDTLQ